MSHNLGTMNAAINLNTNQFDRGVRKATGGLKSIGATVVSLNQGVDLLTRAWRGFDRVVNNTLKSFIEAADEMEKYQITLRNTLGSQREGMRMFQEMSRFAQTAPFEFAEVMKSAAALSGIMRGGVEEIKEWMPGIADLASVYNMTLEDATNNISRMYAAGAAAAVGFQQSGVSAAMGFQQGMDYSLAETRRMVKDYFNQIEGAAQDFANTWSGMTSMLSDKWMAFRTMAMDTGLFDHMKERLADFIDMLDEMQDTGKMQHWAENVAVIFGALMNHMIAAGAGFLKLLTSISIVLLDIKMRLTDLKISQMQDNISGKGALPKNIEDAPWYIRWAAKMPGVDYEAAQKEDEQWRKALEVELNEMEEHQLERNEMMRILGETLEAIASGKEFATLDLSSLLKRMREAQDKEDGGPEELKDTIVQLSQEAIQFGEQMDKAFRQAEFDVATASMQDYERQLAQINYDLEEMRLNNEEAFSEVPEFEERLKQLGDLRREALAISTVMDMRDKGDNFFESQLAGIEGSGVLITNYAERTKQLQDDFEQFIETNKELLEEFPHLIDELGVHFDNLTEKLKANAVANEIKGVFDNAAQHFTNFLYQFAETGRASFKQLVSDLMKMLQMMAAQKTAKLLMEAAYQSVMAFINPEMGHGAKAATAYRGAALMGSFVAGSGLAGMAHKGITDIPEDGTWLLKKNERVVDTETNKDLKEYLKEAGRNTGSIQVVFNNSDQESVEKALPALRRTILDVVGGDIANNGQTLKIIRNTI